MKDDIGHIPPELSGLKDTAPLRDALLKLQAYRDAGEPEGLIDTDHLHYLIARLKHSQTICVRGMDGLDIRQRMTRGRLMKRWMQAARDMARLGRELFKLDKHNHFIKTKWEMLRDPSWRARVIRDLGGERALQMWERRFAKAKVRKPAADVYGPPQILPAMGKPLSQDEEIRGVKTDSKGQFRLAPIDLGPRPWRLAIFRRRTRNYTWDPSLEARERTFPPISVTAGELRSEGRESAIQEDEPHNPHPEADTSSDGSGTRRARVMATYVTDARTLRDALRAPQGEGKKKNVPP